MFLPLQLIIEFCLNMLHQKNMMSLNAKFCFFIFICDFLCEMIEQLTFQLSLDFVMVFN